MRDFVKAIFIVCLLLLLVGTPIASLVVADSNVGVSRCSSDAVVSLPNWLIGYATASLLSYSILSLGAFCLYQTAEQHIGKRVLVTMAVLTLVIRFGWFILGSVALDHSYAACQKEGNSLVIMTLFAELIEVITLATGFGLLTSYARPLNR